MRRAVLLGVLLHVLFLNACQTTVIALFKHIYLYLMLKLVQSKSK